MKETIDKKTKAKSKIPFYKKFILISWCIFLLGIASVYGIFWMIRHDVNGWFGGLPTYEQLENPKSDLASELYSSDGVLLGKYFRVHRSQVGYDEISPNIKNALIATEDNVFFEHAGISLRALYRVLWYSAILRQDAGGGSTISQQLAKNLFQTRDDLEGSLAEIDWRIGLVIAKLKEWVVAVQLETSYTKEEIMAMYLNTVFFGSNSYGIEVASQTFFNKPQNLLTVEEAALLVGLVQRPSGYNPNRYPKAAKTRRNTVLNQMEKYGYLAEAKCDSLKELPIKLDYKVKNHNYGLATYFRSVIRDELMKWTKDNNYDLWEDGLKIYTTIDSRMQEYAEQAVEEHMKALQTKFDTQSKGRTPWIDDKGKPIPNFIESEIKRTQTYRDLKRSFDGDSVKIWQALKKPKDMTVFSWNGDIDTTMSSLDSLKYYKKFLHTGFMAMDPHNGEVKAWVGGINHKYFKYDHVKYGKRQPGSTFKPIVYAAAIDNGYSPCYEVVDAPVTFPMPNQDPPTWTPQNSNSKFSGEVMTLRQAMARSINSITAFVMSKIGPQTVVNYAKRLGISSPLEPVPSLCLGVSDVSIYELIGAYSTFVNRGVYTQPRFITKIEDKNGTVLQEFPAITKEALNEETAYMMLYMLRGTTEEIGGTGQGVGWELKRDNELGGKTGTTQNASDGWFMGVTKDLVAGAWTGGENRSVHFRSWVDGQGARTAMPIWKIFMTKVYADKELDVEKGAFPRPRKLSKEIDCNIFQMQNMVNDSTLMNDSTMLLYEPVEEVDLDDIQ
ncbi:penicillin-binding protein 1A [Aureibacter tunicatorum]|uniref:Penicillin-binding protein 1A n=1 Tax=Aureibacter tunicatorum TaxID=866807 RepID=A0AAE3XIU9_9BACT|nr:transglycosylase domain-containing protein [Aureibacter tunicatorum]MDR6237202.1 penicillin-binding protein 1A [Aureibacter tunicatorum]BDD06194.1 penicillin-binding protein 1A [Aureibacter tunicatorum]